MPIVLPLLSNMMQFIIQLTWLNHFAIICFLQIGEVIIKDDCQETLTCQKSGIVKHESMKCNTDEVCRVENGVRGCYPKQCMLEAAGSFTLFNGRTWLISSIGAFDLVKICDDTVIDVWFRVVVVLQENTGVISTAAVHVFFENVFVTVSSQAEIWVSKKIFVPFSSPIHNLCPMPELNQTLNVTRTEILLPN